MQFDRVPYFMRNTEWFTTVHPGDGDSSLEVPERGLALTDGAPQRAVDSYNAFYKILDSDDAASMGDEDLIEAAFGDS